jgi:hypothetical protein
MLRLAAHIDHSAHEFWRLPHPRDGHKIRHLATLSDVEGEDLFIRLKGQIFGSFP